MGKPTTEEIHEQFWINAELSVETLLKEWKARKFTRQQMVVGAVNAFTNNGESGIVVGSYIYAVMAERLINSIDEKEQAKAE